MVVRCWWVEAGGAMSVLRCCMMSVAMGMALGGGCLRAGAQASALPSAQIGAANGDAGKGRALLDEMVAALGGQAWLDRKTWMFAGRTATFYKGEPKGVAPEFEEYGRVRPFGERVVMVSHYGAVVAKDHRDVAEVWTSESGYEVTYKGVTPLPAKDVAEFERWRGHSVDVVVKEWVKQPGMVVTYAGSKMVERSLVDEVSVLSAGDDAVTLDLDAVTHLPLSVSFRWRDPVFEDWNTEVQEFADYHAVQGIMTPYSVITMHNGDMTGERFLTRVSYNVTLPAELFDPNQRLEKK
jgi:hypothetical protein